MPPSRITADVLCLIAITGQSTIDLPSFWRRHILIFITALIHKTSVATLRGADQKTRRPMVWNGRRLPSPLHTFDKQPTVRLVAPKAGDERKSLPMSASAVVIP